MWSAHSDRRYLVKCLVERCSGEGRIVFRALMVDWRDAPVMWALTPVLVPSLTAYSEFKVDNRNEARKCFQCRAGKDFNRGPEMKPAPPPGSPLLPRSYGDRQTKVFFVLLAKEAEKMGTISPTILSWAPDIWTWFTLLSRMMMRSAWHKMEWSWNHRAESVGYP